VRARHGDAGGCGGAWRCPRGTPALLTRPWMPLGPTASVTRCAAWRTLSVLQGRQGAGGGAGGGRPAVRRLVAALPIAARSRPSAPGRPPALQHCAAPPPAQPGHIQQDRLDSRVERAQRRASLIAAHACENPPPLFSEMRGGRLADAAARAADDGGRLRRGRDQNQPRAAGQPAANYIGASGPLRGQCASQGHGGHCVTGDCERSSRSR
jgi:hypothetical protein